MIARSVAQTQKTNLATIIDECQDKIELQNIVLSTIAEYKAALVKANEENTTVVEMLSRKRARGHAVEEPGGRPAALMAISPTEQLPRNCANFRIWGAKLLRHLLAYIEDEMDCQSAKDLAKDALQHCLEYALDLRITGEKTDTVATMSKLACFDALKRVYLRKGRRLRGVDISGVIEWSRVGHYSVTDTSEADNVRRVKVTNKTIATSTWLPQELVDEDPTLQSDVGIRCNFSQFEAYIMIAGDEYKLQNLFPVLGRRLHRHN